jgi:hypothetical protein
VNPAFIRVGLTDISHANFMSKGRRPLNYRLVDQSMRQPRLMKFNIINLDENNLSSDIVSIAWAYFLNPPHPSLKYPIQFFLIDTLQNLLQTFKKLVLVSHLNPFELFFNCRKQTEVIRGQIR